MPSRPTPTRASSVRHPRHGHIAPGRWPQAVATHSPNLTIRPGDRCRRRSGDLRRHLSCFGTTLASLGVTDVSEPHSEVSSFIKFGLVVLRRLTSPEAAGNRDDSLPFFMRRFHPSGTALAHQRITDVSQTHTVRFLHLFKVWVNSFRRLHASEAAGNRDDSLLFFRLGRRDSTDTSTTAPTHIDYRPHTHRPPSPLTFRHENYVSIPLQTKPLHTPQPYVHNATDTSPPPNLR